MKLLILGCGSIGQRHAKNAKEFADIHLCDNDEKKASTLAKELNCAYSTDIDAAFESGADGIIVALPNKHHYEAALKALKTGAFVLVEKPLCIDMKQAGKLVAAAEDRLYVVCNMRFHQAILALQETMKYIGKPLFIRSHFGNYLPNMRPGIDYRSLYVARHEDGGGVVMDCIHELDYLQYLFGPVLNMTAHLDKISDLEIETEDYAALIMEHGSGVKSEVHFDYLQQVKQRGCEIIGTEGTAVWKSTGKNPEHCSVKYFTKENGDWTGLIDTNSLDGNECYVSLIKAFCDTISGKQDPVLATAKEGMSALACVKGAHLSSKQARSVTINALMKEAA